MTRSFLLLLWLALSTVTHVFNWIFLGEAILFQVPFASSIESLVQLHIISCHTHKVLFEFGG